MKLHVLTNVVILILVAATTYVIVDSVQHGEPEDLALALMVLGTAIYAVVADRMSHRH